VKREREKRVRAKEITEKMMSVVLGEFLNVYYSIIRNWSVSKEHF
jgi:hypothetical protein